MTMMKQDQQNNATNQDWKHKKGYGSTVLLAVVAICGLVAVTTNGNSRWSTVTSSVDGNFIRSKHDKISSTYEDSCLRDDLTKEELADTMIFLEDQYVIPYLKTMGRKELVDSVAVTPGVVPSDVEVLDPSDDSSVAASSLIGCVNVNFDFFKVVEHKGTICTRGDVTVVIKGQFLVLGNTVETYEYSIGNDTNFPLVRFNVGLGSVEINVRAVVTGDRYVEFCGVFKIIFVPDQRACTGKIRF